MEKMHLPAHLTSSRLAEVSRPLANFLSLSKLPDHAPAIVFSFVFFNVVYLVFAPWISLVLAKKMYTEMTHRARNNWCTHIVSTVHALLIIPLAFRCLLLPALDMDRAFGWDEKVGVVEGVACGYFLWDTMVSIIHFTDIGFVLHGLSCVAIYTLTFKPFLAYYGIRFLFWETSTIFLNIHWFLDKSGFTGSKLQLINGFCLLLTFFSMRIVWGGKMSYDFFHTLYEVRQQIPRSYALVYGVGNVLLQGLNWFWFSKMIGALQKRFRSTKGVGSDKGMNGLVVDKHD